MSEIDALTCLADVEHNVEGAQSETAKLILNRRSLDNNGTLTPRLDTEMSASQSSDI
jgi:hypothetical protein